MSTNDLGSLVAVKLSTAVVADEHTVFVIGLGQPPVLDAAGIAVHALETAMCSALWVGSQIVIHYGERAPPKVLDYAGHKRHGKSYCYKGNDAPKNCTSGH